MGILNEMFGEENQDDISLHEGEFIAKGEYESRPEEVLDGYGIYQKRYVFKSLALKLILVLIALASSVMMIITSSGNDIMPIFCLLICISIGIWFISQPITNKKNLRRALEIADDTKYQAEFFTDRIIISDISSPDNKKEEKPENGFSDNEAPEEKKEDQEEKPEKPPATIIHLDSHIVDLLDKSDIFILIVNKSYVFIIPKRGFTEDDIQRIREKLSVIMGIRYKVL